MPATTASQSSQLTPTPTRRKFRMLVYIPIALAAIVALFLCVAAMQPSNFRVARTTTISAPPAAIFAHVNDFRKWADWNPWGKIDPAMKVTYEGAPAGTGAVYTWAGNSQVGEGRMTIAESNPPDLIRIAMEFKKPFAGNNIAEFTFQPERNQTVVTWSMSGNNNLFAKSIHLVMNMDKMIGGQFEKGLADMKAVVEAESET